ncbi:hypothetical protein BZA77DRAFT_344652 [Pyronema omphalodes]|nr:hypothetical protein BZA77DRAFT_344652 [Pyronema omphalodes]
MIRDMASTELMYRYFQELAEHPSISELQDADVDAEKDEEATTVISDIKDIELHNYQQDDGSGTALIDQIRGALQERRVELLRSLHKATHQILFLHDRIQELSEKQSILLDQRVTALRNWRKSLKKRHIPGWVIDNVIQEPKWEGEKQYQVFEMIKNDFGWWLAELDRKRTGITQVLAEVDNEYLRRLEYLAENWKGRRNQGFTWDSVGYDGSYDGDFCLLVYILVTPC